MFGITAICRYTREFWQHLAPVNDAGVSEGNDEFLAVWNLKNPMIEKRLPLVAPESSNVEKGGNCPPNLKKTLLDAGLDLRKASFPGDLRFWRRRIGSRAWIL